MQNYWPPWRCEHRYRGSLGKSPCSDLNSTTTGTPDSGHMTSRSSSTPQSCGGFFFNGLSATLGCVCVFSVVVGSGGCAGFPPAGFCSSYVDVAEEDTSCDAVVDNPRALGSRGVALGVLPGVAWRSRVLMSSARSLVAASRIDLTPVSCRSLARWIEN